MTAIYNFFIVYGFIFELVLSFALFTFFFGRRKLFWLRLIACIACLFAFSWLRDATPSDSPWWQALKYMVLYATCLGSLFFLFGEPARNILFAFIGASLTQHCAFKLGDLVRYVIAPQTDIVNAVVYCGIVIAVNLFIYIFLARRRQGGFEGLPLTPILALGGAMLVVCVLFQQLFHKFQPGGDGLQFLLEGVGDVDLVHAGGKIHLFTGDAHHTGRYAHGGGVGGNLAQNHRVGGDAGIVPHLEGTQHLGAGGDHHIIPQGGVALALILAGTAQGNPVVDEAVVPHLGGLADDDAHTVVDDEAAADLGPGVDLDARPEAAPLGDEAGQKFQVMTVEKMGDAVVNGGVYAGIEQENLQLAPGRRVAGLIGRQGLA